MNCTIALSALVIGIILLCLYTYNVEGFIQSPTFNNKKVILAAGKQVSIYLFQDSKGMLTFKSASDPAFNKVTGGQNKCTIAMTGTLNDYAVYGYQDTCKKCLINEKTCPEHKQLIYTPDTKQKCYNLAIQGITVSSGGKNFPSVLSSSILTTMASLNKLPQKFASLSIDGLSVANLGTKPTMIDSNGANVCIELSLA